MTLSAIILGICQFLFMASVAVGLSFNALVGKMLAPSADLSTLPFLFMMGTTAFLTLKMPHWLLKSGYRNVFIAGASAGTCGGLLALAALQFHNFWIFCLASMLMGLYQATAMYYRFAAADGVGPAQKGQAIAWVMNGGILAALLGPVLGSASLHSLSLEYAGSYLATSLLALIALPFIARAPLPARGAGVLPVALNKNNLDSNILSAIIFCASGYAMMGMVMLASPLAMSGCGYHAKDAASVIQWHLLGMFAPSLITGKLIARFTAQRVAIIGIAILTFGCVIALSGNSLNHFHVALLLVGIGWNFMYMGGSTLVAQIDNMGLRVKVQSINEFVTFATITLISGLTGWFYNWAGWAWILGLAIFILVSVFFIIPALKFWRHAPVAAE